MDSVEGSGGPGLTVMDHHYKPVVNQQGIEGFKDFDTMRTQTQHAFIS
ncbi:MAG: hypothetical protein IPO92_07260 [Saprospiraceae bacterium]|nr:hypothetical protein [Saprospiraceae bacterium]